jgi:predicted dehydrogenase
MPPPQKLRVGIVSANWGALAHLPAWRMLADRVEVTAICTSREETALTAAARFDVPRPFWDFADMCSDPNIDIVDAGTTPALREKIVACALSNGKHVVNQVPFATSAAAAADLHSVQALKGSKGIVAASVLGLPHLARLKDLIEAGEIGEMFQIHCSWQLSFFLNISPSFPYLWFGQAGQGVSVTRNQGSHMLHAMRHIAGPIAEVCSSIATKLKHWDLPEGGRQAVETDDCCQAMLRFESGAMGTLSTSWVAADAPGFHLDVLGSKGRLRLDAVGYPSVSSAKLYFAKVGPSMIPSGSLVEIPAELFKIADKGFEFDETDQFNGGQRLSIARLFDQFVTSIDHGDEPLGSFARAAEIQNLIEALYTSRDTRAWAAPMNNLKC